MSSAQFARVETPPLPSPRRIAEKPKSKEEKEIAENFKEAGFEKELDGKIIEKLARLKEESGFYEESCQVQIGVSNILDELNLTGKKNEVNVAALLHDIGKTGPAEANEKESKAIIKIFAQRKINDENLSLEEGIRMGFSDNEYEAKKIIEIIKKMNVRFKNELKIDCKINLNMTMRQFWDMHGQWTNDILKKHPLNLNEEIITIAGSHHFYRGGDLDPYAISDSKALRKIKAEAAAIGLMEEYWTFIIGRILAAVDQYEASVRRSRHNHEEAIKWVRNNLMKFEKTKGDKMMALVCDIIDELGRNGKIFLSKAAKKTNN